MTIQELINYLEKEIKNFEPEQMTYKYLTFILKQIHQLKTLSKDWIRTNEEQIYFKEPNNAWWVEAKKLEGVLMPRPETTIQDAHDKIREECSLTDKSFDYYWNCIADDVEIDEPGNLLVPKQEDINKEKLEAYAKGFEAGEKQTVKFYEEHESKDFNKKVNQLIKAIENPKRIKLRDVIERMDALSEKNRNDWLERINERYEAEEEQKYYLKTPYYNQWGKNLYVKDLKNGLIEIRENVKEAKKYSENEIKKMENGNVLFEHFAVKVEEMEEC